MSQSINIIESTKYNTKVNSTDNKSFINKNMFDFNYIIGKGGFGKVWRVLYKKTKEIFALKEMSKKKIIDKKSEKSINNERVILSKLCHPFLVNMHYAFQDHDNLYLVIDILNGGDLRFHCSRYRKFSEEQTRFFIACIVYALSYIHKNNVIHRDIKPENLILDDKGYLHITDFGIAKENCSDNSSETSGTPGYMAPEVMRGMGHSFSVDYFAIGVIGYEFMLGKRPYSGKNRKEIKEKMFSYQAKIKRNEIPEGWSSDSRDFINKLIKKKPELRLGSKDGIQELKEHYWLRYYPWKELENKTLPGPFIPEKKDNFDKRYCERIDKISENTRLRYEEIARSDNYKTVFANFYFNKEDIVKINIKINSNKQNTTDNKSFFIENLSNINSPIQTNSIINLKQNKNINLKKSYIINEEKNINKKDINTNNNNELSQIQINDNLYNQKKERPLSSRKKKRQKIKKSSSQQLYEGIKSKEKSLYVLLNSNSGIISVKSKRNENNDINNNKNNQNQNSKRIDNNNFINKINQSFRTLELIKRDLNCNNTYLLNKNNKDYHSHDKKSSEYKTIKLDILNNKSFSFLKSHYSPPNGIKFHNGKNVKLYLLKNKILNNQTNKSNNNNYLLNKKDLFKNFKNNNSFLLNKKNTNKLDLSRIRLYNLKKQSIINNNSKFYKINLHKIKGNQTLRREFNNLNSIIKDNTIIKIHNYNSSINKRSLNKNNSADLLISKRTNDSKIKNINNKNNIYNIEDNNKKIDNNINNKCNLNSIM